LTKIPPCQIIIKFLKEGIMEWLDKLTQEYEDQKAISQKRTTNEQQALEAQRQQKKKSASDALNLLATKLVPIIENLEKKHYPCKIDKNEMKSVDTHEMFVESVGLKINNLAGSRSNPRHLFDSWCLSIKTNFDGDIEIKTTKPNGREAVKTETISPQLFTDEKLDRLIEVFLKRVFRLPDAS
jgi:hypothetical protein